MRITFSGVLPLYDIENPEVLALLSWPLMTSTRMRFFRIPTFSSEKSASCPGSENSLNSLIIFSRLVRLVMCWEMDLIRDAASSDTTDWM